MLPPPELGVLGVTRRDHGSGSGSMVSSSRGVASWSHRFAADRMHLTVTSFIPDGFVLPAWTERAFEEIGHLLGAAGVEIAVA